MNGHLIGQLLFSFLILGVFWVICAVYYLKGLRRGYDAGAADGIEAAKQMLVMGIKSGQATLDGQKIVLEKPFVPDDGLIYGLDGNQHTCQRPDFVNLQESLCGFGDTPELAKADLLKREAESKG
jgi:hypothetical protein